MNKQIFRVFVSTFLLSVLFSCEKNFPDGGEYQEPTFLKIVGGTTHPKNSTRKFYTYYLENGNYEWSVPPDAQILSGQGKSTIELKFGVENGKLTVKAKGKEASLDITLQ